MTQYYITKGPAADNTVAIAQKDLSATKIEITKNPSVATASITIQKNAATKVRIVKSGGETL